MCWHVGRDLPAAVWPGGSLIDHVGPGCELSTASGCQSGRPSGQFRRGSGGAGSPGRPWLRL